MADDERITSSMMMLPSEHVSAAVASMAPHRVFMVTNRWRDQLGHPSEERAAPVFVYGFAAHDAARWAVGDLVPTELSGRVTQHVTVLAPAPPRKAST